MEKERSVFVVTSVRNNVVRNELFFDYIQAAAAFNEIVDVNSSMVWYDYCKVRSYAGTDKQIDYYTVDGRNGGQSKKVGVLSIRKEFIH
jgi:hypothetical protein